MVEKAWRQELEATSHIAPTVRKQEERWCAIWGAKFSIPVWIAACELVPLTFRVALSASINPI